MNKFKKGDQVVVLSGKDKGKKGVIRECCSLEYVIVDGVNGVKKALKQDPAKDQVGGIVDRFMPLHVSKIAILNPVSNKADRIGFKYDGDAKKRYYKSTGDFVN